MSGDRGSLVADLKAERAQAEHDALVAEQHRRQALADEKQAKAETWAKEANRIKSLAEKYQDDAISLKDFKSEIAKSKEKFTDNTDDLDNIFRQSVRNRDTIKYNNYINGGMQFEDFKAYYDSRKKDGGDLSNLENLLSQSRLHEDTNQYNLYHAGVISYDQLKAYHRTRVKDGGDLTKLNGYVAMAKTNENKINDQLQAAQYQASGDAAAYKSYLESRIKDTVDPKEATAIRTALKTVEINEVMKSADDVRAQYEGGQITGGEAATRLMGLRSGTNDASTQTKILNLVGQIQNADRTKGNSASAAVNNLVNNLRNVENDARGDYDKEQTAITARLSKAGGGDYSRLVDAMYISNAKYRSAVTMAGSNMPDPVWQKEFENKAKALDSTLSSQMYLAATTIAENMVRSTTNEKTGVNINKFGDAAKFLIGTASENPHMSAKDRLSLIQAGQQTMQRGFEEWNNSTEGIQWRDFVNNRTNELINKGGIVELAKNVGVDPSLVTDANSARALVEKTLIDQPDKVRDALEKSGVRGFKDIGLRDQVSGQGKFIEKESSDEFSKQVAGLTATLRALTDAAADLHRKSYVSSNFGGPMSPIDLAYNDIINPERKDIRIHEGDAPNVAMEDRLDDIRANRTRTIVNPRTLRDEGDNNTEEPVGLMGSSMQDKPSGMPSYTQHRGGPMGIGAQFDPEIHLDRVNQDKGGYNPGFNLQGGGRGGPGDPRAKPPTLQPVGRESREGPYNVPTVNGGSAPKSPSLALTSVEQNPYAGNDSLDATADPYAYLQSILNMRQDEWSLTTPPTSDIAPPNGFGGTSGSFGEASGGNLLSE